MINQINNIAYITNNLMDRQVNELMNSYINKYMDTDIMEQGTDRRNGTRKDSSKNKGKKKEEKSPSKTTLPKVFSLWRGYWQLRVKIFSFPATTEKRKKSWKKKWIEWSELVPVRVEGAEAPVSQLEEGQAANLPFFYHRRRSRGASLALTLPQEGGQAFPPLSSQRRETTATNSQPYSNTGQNAQALHLPSFFYHKWKGKSNSYPFSSQKGQRSNSLPYSITRKHRSTNSCPNFTPRRWTIVYHLSPVF